MEQLTLQQLNQEETGRVVELVGGCGLTEKLNNMGIRKGKKLTKVSDSFIGGPVTVRFDNTKVAIGSGMAEKIIVEVDN